MMLLLIFSMLILIISIIVMLISSFLSNKLIMDREKKSPFECGFDPKKCSRIPFSLRFFLIAVIFLIFDVEITLLLPMMLMLYTSYLSYWIWTSFFFIMILLIGLFHEWNQGSLKWAE
uniref:NADH-ubiquinone oxidoreductase chain 3 n=1 Tax=Pamphilius sp. ZJUH_2016023 TaxID=2491164 RepID=A0A3S5HLP9_9HYME|nr:NADH dehydrogenase subunit 3 [Pamphilius sp. ZJUH_2016023]